MFPTPLHIQVDSSIVVQSVDPANAAALYHLVATNTAHLQRYLPKAVEEMNSLQGARDHIERVQRLTAQGDILECHVFFDTQLCGVIRLNNVEPENHKLSIAYFLDAAFQGKGIITRAAHALIAYCFRDLAINRIELRCVTTNHASVAVAQRLGFTREGELRQAELLADGYVNHYVYSLLRAEHHRQTHPPGGI